MNKVLDKSFLALAGLIGFAAITFWEVAKGIYSYITFKLKHKDRNEG